MIKSQGGCSHKFRSTIPPRCCTTEKASFPEGRIEPEYRRVALSHFKVHESLASTNPNSQNSAKSQWELEVDRNLPNILSRFGQAFYQTLSPSVCDVAFWGDESVVVRCRLGVSQHGAHPNDRWFHGQQYENNVGWMIANGACVRYL